MNIIDVIDLGFYKIYIAGCPAVKKELDIFRPFLRK
jgi:hypothetical protein